MKTLIRMIDITVSAYKHIYICIYFTQIYKNQTEKAISSVQKGMTPVLQPNKNFSQRFEFALLCCSEAGGVSPKSVKSHL